MQIEVQGMLGEPKHLPGGHIYRGRLTLPGVQWTGGGSDIFATATVTAEQLVDAADNQILWTDQSVQRGLNPGSAAGVPRELAVASGYPDKRNYIFDASNADDMTEKLLRGERLFLSPLVWNLRPGTFEAFWSEEEGSIFIYSGKVFLPDSHHRHQAIIKAVRAYYATIRKVTLGSRSTANSRLSCISWIVRTKETTSLTRTRGRNRLPNLRLTISPPRTIYRCLPKECWRNRRRWLPASTERPTA